MSELIDTPVFHNLARGLFDIGFWYPSLVRTQCYLVILQIKLVRIFWIHHSNEISVCTTFWVCIRQHLFYLCSWKWRFWPISEEGGEFLLLIWVLLYLGLLNQDTAACPSPAGLKLWHHHICPQLHITVEQSSLHLPCILYDTFHYRWISMVCCVPGFSDSWMVPLFYLDIHKIDSSANQELILIYFSLPIKLLWTFEHAVLW